MQYTTTKPQTAPAKADRIPGLGLIKARAMLRKLNRNDSASQRPKYHAAPIFDTPHAAKVRAQLDALRKETNGEGGGERECRNHFERKAGLQIAQVFD